MDKWGSAIIQGHSTDNDGNMSIAVELPKNARDHQSYLDGLMVQITDILGIEGGIISGTTEHQVAFVDTTEKGRKAYVREKVQAAKEELKRGKAEAQRKGKSFDDRGMSEKVSKQSAVAAQLDNYRESSQNVLKKVLERLDQDLSDVDEGAKGRSVRDLAPFYVDSEGNVILVHFSNKGDLKTIQPEFYGTQEAGREKQRKDAYGCIVQLLDCHLVIS